MLVIVTILLVLVACNMFIHYMGVAAEGALIGTDVIKLIGMTLPRYLAMLLPVAFYLAIVFSAGKLFQDNELTVLFACGISWRRLMGILFVPGIFLMLVVGVISLVFMPRLSVHLDQLATVAASQNNLQFIQPGRFVPLNGGQQVIYIGNSDLSNLTVSDLFVYRDLPGADPQVILAPYGYQHTDPKTHETYITLKNGQVYTIPKKGKDYQIIHFERYQLQLASPSIGNQQKSVSSMGTISLLKQATLEAQAELQWRFALPLSVMVLLLLGLAVCYVEPRQGRYTKIIPALLLFMLYFNLLTIAKTWLEEGDLASWLGLWWVHGLFALGALLILWQRDGYAWCRLPWGKKKR